MRILSLVALLLSLVAGCGSTPGGVSTPANDTPTSTEPPPTGVQSSDILAREADANRVSVQHILIGWRDLGDAYPGGAMHPRAQARSAEDAEELVQELLERARAGEPFDELMREHSEDEASARGGSITVTPDASLVLDFKRLSLRLTVGEIGVVGTPYGWHIIQRID